MIEGSYDLNGQRMQTYNRIVIATGTPPRQRPGRVPGPADRDRRSPTRRRPEAPDIEAIITGFTVAAEVAVTGRGIGWRP